MKLHYIVRSIFSAVLVAMTSTAAAYAQQPADPFREAVGRIAVEYWQPLLNVYKNAIDRLLTPDDLTELNQLRVRWSIMIAEQAETRDALGRKSGQNATDGSVDMEIDLQRGAEILHVMEQAQQIASRYPAGMSEIGRRVIEDFRRFAQTLPKETDRALAAGGIAITGEAAIEQRRTLDRMTAAIASESGAAGLRSIYDLAFEPIVLLYSGSDLRQMIAASSGSTGIDGRLLPEASLLSQNHPNPASTTTTIGYTLREATTSTLIRIYNATGTEVMTLDEGARPAGAHTRTIDVSALPSGSYLYQLALRTATGDQVHAKMMRVVR